MILASLIIAARAYAPMQTLPYCTVEGHTLSMNAFLPTGTAHSVGAMVEIHGGWFVGGDAMTAVPQVIKDRGLAFFSITYRLGDQGGFPQCISDCRNAVRFVRKNTAKFNVDPNRIAVCGGSAGGHLSLMVAMVPDNFDGDDIPPGLKGVSAKVCGAFSWIPPTDFVRFWDQGPSDQTGPSSFRHWDDNVPNDARPHLRGLFHGVGADTPAGRALYTKMCPIGYVRKDVPPLLICDGEHDPIVPGLEGKELYEQLKRAGADATYWMSPGGHDYPSGPGFDAVLAKFLDKVYAPQP